MTCTFTENKIFTLYVITTSILPAICSEKDMALESTTSLGPECQLGHGQTVRYSANLTFFESILSL